MRPLCQESLRLAVRSDIERIEFDVLFHQGEWVLAHDEKMLFKARIY
jgi:hypothetical protein